MFIDTANLDIYDAANGRCADPSITSARHRPSWSHPSSSMIDPALGSLRITSFRRPRTLVRDGGVRTNFGDLAALYAGVCRLSRDSRGAGSPPGAGASPAPSSPSRLALVWPPSRRWAASAAAGLLIVYAPGMGVNLARGRRDLDCGCGAAGNRRAIAAWMVWRNLILAPVLDRPRSPGSPRPLSRDRADRHGRTRGGVTLYAALDRLLGDVAPRAIF